jgi:hypothetical protein
MRTTATNPSDNQLAPGITEQQIEDAVRSSGYPLQTLIASSLRTDFSIQEEWSYLDSETGVPRTLDILATRWLYDFKRQVRVRPVLNLLIECKQSDLPFIFFSSGGSPQLLHFPFVAGLANETIEIRTDDDRSSWVVPVTHALGLDTHPFVNGDIELCMYMSKCVRKGKELELAGSDAFHSIVLPLVKALRDFKRQEQPKPTYQFFDCHITLAIAVLDAPMITARLENGSTALELRPWVRVLRHEAAQKEATSNRMQTFAIDMVHKAFFDTYLQQHAIPFALAVSTVAMKHQDELSTGKAFASGMATDRSTGIEQRLQPRKK